METIGTLLFLYTETPLHAGSGTSLGAVDLPLQRERMSNLPLVQSSGVKGSLREIFRNRRNENSQTLTVALFGPEPPSGAAMSGEEADEAITHAGALSIGDARLLLLPARTVFGGWAWTTCPLILSRIVRDWECVGKKAPSWYGKAEASLLDDPKVLGLVSKSSRISPNNRLLIEDTEYPVLPNDVVGELATWLAENALPQTPSYEPFRKRLAEQLVILNDEEFAFLCQHGTEVVTRIRIDPQTGTVAKGALWTEENLPAESLLWSLGLLSKDRRPEPKKKDGSQSPAVKPFELADMFGKFTEVMKQGGRIRLGGDRTIGRGMLSVRLSEGVIR
jgi:CRISPR-associated protein Cmr4